MGKIGCSWYDGSAKWAQMITRMVPTPPPPPPPPPRAVSGVPDSIDLSGEETLALVSAQAKPAWKSSPAKSLIKRGFFGLRAAASSTVVVDVLPDPACELICRGSLSVGAADLGRSLS
jgi:hypothetical protein